MRYVGRYWRRPEESYVRLRSVSYTHLDVRHPYGTADTGDNKSPLVIKFVFCYSIVRFHTLQSLFPFSVFSQCTNLALTGRQYTACEAEAALL